MEFLSDKLRKQNEAREKERKNINRILKKVKLLITIFFINIFLIKNNDFIFFEKEFPSCSWFEISYFDIAERLIKSHAVWRSLIFHSVLSERDQPVMR